MKILKNYFFTVTLLSMSITLFAVSANDTTKVSTELQNPLEEKIYSEEEYKILAKAQKTIRKSEMAVENLMDDPRNSIPPSLISQSEGIVIFPRALKVAFGTFGGQAARGIAMIRQEDGSWSNPYFVTFGEGSVGVQIGVQKSDIVLIFKNRNDIIAIDEADIMLGTGIGVTAGPTSREIASATDFSFDAEIYSYQHSKGLFAGLSLKGGVLSCNDSFNETLYNIEDADTDDIFNEIEAPYNNHVNDLIETLEMQEE